MYPSSIYIITMYNHHITYSLQTHQSIPAMQCSVFGTLIHDVSCNSSPSCFHVNFINHNNYICIIIRPSMNYMQMPQNQYHDQLHYLMCIIQTLLLLKIYSLQRSMAVFRCKKYLFCEIAGLCYTRAYVMRIIVQLSHSHMCNYRAI